MASSVFASVDTMIHGMSMKSQCEEYDKYCDKIVDKLGGLRKSHTTTVGRYYELKTIVGNLDYELSNFNHLESCLGDLKVVKWARFETSLHTTKTMSCMDIIPGDGGIGVGYWEGGVEIFNSDGSREIIVLNVSVMAVAFLNNGHFVLRDMNNVLAVYNAKSRKEENKLKGENFEMGGYGDLAVDSKNNIYASYRGILKVYVYHMAKGCEPFIIIDCHGVQPHHIAAISPEIIVMTDTNTLSIVGHGAEGVGEVHREGFIGYPTVTEEGCILVAWIKPSENMISVMKYNQNLQYQGIVLKNKDVNLTGQKLYYLRELNRKKIAFCTAKKLYIFKYITEKFESLSLEAEKEITEL